MKTKRIMAAVIATAGLTAGLTAVAGSAHAEDLTCYEVGFDHSPSAGVVLSPPRVIVDDGDPYVRQYSC